MAANRGSDRFGPTAWRLGRSAAAVWGLLLTAACASSNPHFDSAKSHHTPSGFSNTDRAAVQAGRFPWYEILWRNLRGDFRPAAEPAGGYEAFAARWAVAPDRALIAQRHDAPVLTWLGHATLLLQVGGRNILIDPQFSMRAGPTSWLGAKRQVAPPLAPEDLPPIDLVLISHNHYDHLDRPSIERLQAAGRQHQQQPRYLVPLGLKVWFDGLAVGHVAELDWWESESVGAIEVGDLGAAGSEAPRVWFVPAQHWSKRTLFDANASLWGGFVIEYRGWRFHYTGDTGYSADFHEIKKRLGPMHYVAVPIGAYLPRDFMRPQHANPDDALQIVADLDAPHAIGVHWGTFGLTREAFDQPPEDLALALAARQWSAERVALYRQGESRRLHFTPP